MSANLGESSNFAPNLWTNNEFVNGQNRSKNNQIVRAKNTIQIYKQSKIGHNIDWKFHVNCQSIEGHEKMESSEMDTKSTRIS